MFWNCTYIHPEQSLPSDTPAKALTSRGSSPELFARLPHIKPATAILVPPTAQTSLFFPNAALFTLDVLGSIGRAFPPAAVSVHRNVRRGTAGKRLCKVTCGSRLVVSSILEMICEDGVRVRELARWMTVTHEDAMDIQLPRVITDCHISCAFPHVSVRVTANVLPRQ